MKNGECKAITWVTECAMRFRRPSVRLSPSTMSSRRWGHYLVVENINGRNELELLVKYSYSLGWKLPTTFFISSRYSRQSSSRSWWSLRQTFRMPHIWRQKEQWTGRKETAESERAAKDVWGGESEKDTRGKEDWAAAAARRWCMRLHCNNLPSWLNGPYRWRPTMLGWSGV